MEVSLKSSLFDGCVVFLSPGSEFSQERDQLAQLLTEHGALVVNNLNKRVDSNFLSFQLLLCCCWKELQDEQETFIKDDSRFHTHTQYINQSSFPLFRFRM